MAKIDYIKIINDYREALRALYGSEIADKSDIYPSSGWIYINLARRFHDGSIGIVEPADDGKRASQVIEMTQNLLKRAKEKQQ